MMKNQKGLSQKNINLLPVGQVSIPADGMVFPKTGIQSTHAAYKKRELGESEAFAPSLPSAYKGAGFHTCRWNGFPKDSGLSEATF